MNGSRTDSLPQKGTKIDDYDEGSSKYIVEIIAPNDMCVSFHQYANNFYIAAELIKDCLLETDSPDIAKLDTYYFALAFLYRNSIELNLKAVAFQQLINSEDQTNFIKITFHNLEEMLKTIVKEKISPIICSTVEMDWLKDYFSDIAKFDRESDSFRYPFHITTNNGKYCVKRVFQNQTYINLEQFVHNFEIAYKIIDKWFNKSNDLINCDDAPVFIVNGGSYYGQSVIGYEYTRDDFRPYISAYLETANFLRNSMREQYDLKYKDEANGLFLPMCYLYRNCVELSLKIVWFQETGVEFQKRCKVMKKKKHKVMGMWNQIKQYAETCISVSYNPDYVDNLESYCRELDEFDHDSDKFRYPSQKDMTPHFKQNKIFDFIHTAVFFEALINALDGIDAELNFQNECLAEMEANSRLEML